MLQMVHRFLNLAKINLKVTIPQLVADTHGVKKGAQKLQMSIADLVSAISVAVAVAVAVASAGEQLTGNTSCNKNLRFNNIVFFLSAYS
ncbi:hypothetical protein JQC92_18820 [Shewanella sp. 202IG2-18]|uniref:hypothetical protein n=1 Tax=Parashewanella hymeniacidonis TaxID=2807618 RepID=UPI0019604133|nr:hypothetical protein [Parashewanella hymeniacidonis]MBM7074059.1 hypothetical protein [Parashewanella hymeniacidonis]